MDIRVGMPVLPSREPGAKFVDMTDRPFPIQDLTGRRRGWVRVGIVINRHLGEASRLIELSRERQWQLISLEKFRGALPERMPLLGAITDHLPSDWHALQMLERGIPTVRIGRMPHPEDHLVPAVMPDTPAAGRLAAEHFAERDFKDVAFVGHKPWGANKPLFDAFAARAEELGIACHLLQTPLSNQPKPQKAGRVKAPPWQSRQEQFTEFVKSLPIPVGLLAPGDYIADRYSYWANEAGLRVPEDLAVMGIGNNELICECAPIPITSVAHDTEGIARTAMQLLDVLMEGGKPDETTVTVPPLGIVCRQSTDSLAASDPRVVRALRYMWDHVTESLSVEDIAERLGISRRTLEKAFRCDLGRGINAEFQRRRLEKACELLLKTDLRIAEIAAALGFSGLKYFGEAFQNAYGMAPSKYRRQCPPRLPQRFIATH